MLLLIASQTILPNIHRASSTQRIFATLPTQPEWIAPSCIAKLISRQFPNENIKLLDVGCGRGHLFDELTKNKVRVERYTGIDFDNRQLAIARQRFWNHQFICSDAFYENTYDEIDSKNNVIVCSGICDCLSPSQIKKLLSIVSKKLLNDDKAQIYINYRTTRATYGVQNPFVIGMGRQIQSGQEKVDDEVFDFVTHYDPNHDLKYYYYSPATFKKLIASCGFAIIEENSQSSPISNGKVEIGKPVRNYYDHVCLKREFTLAINTATSAGDTPPILDA